MSTAEQPPLPDNGSNAAWGVGGLELLPPNRLVQPDSWVGHIPFAFWLVQAVRPKTLVELGVHTGNSYCAFAQAVATLGLETRSFGVDHWMGDEHAGLYGDDVYYNLKEYHDPLYGRFSTLLRMSFEDARAHIPDGSVDLLHIDGLHTYEAVREDYQSWLAKMSRHGVVLFHDTNVRHGDFGVWKLWAEIEAAWPSVEFVHSNGLGVAYVGSEPPPARLEALLASSQDGGLDAMRRYFARLGDALVDRLATREAVRMREVAEERSDALADAVREIHQDLLAARSETGTLSAERDHWRAYADRATSWDELSRHLAKTTARDLTSVARAVCRLANTDSPGVMEDRGYLGEVLGRLVHNEPLKPPPPPEPPRSSAEYILRMTRRVARRVLSEPAPPPPPPPVPVDPELQAIRESGLFDPAFYALTKEAEEQGRDPLEHYLEAGEPLGIAPSAGFEPDYYARRYPDVLESGIGLLRHYALFGRAEGRQGVSPATRMVVKDMTTSARKRVLVVLHEASRTGAPILGWNIARDLQERYDVVVVLKQGGVLEADFADVCSDVVMIPDYPALTSVDFDRVVERLVARVRPSFAIANSAETRDVVPRLTRAGVGVVSLIHEFAANVAGFGLYDVLLWAHHVVFPADVVARSYDAAGYRFLRQRRHTIAAQGVPVLPPRQQDLLSTSPRQIRNTLRGDAEADCFVVVGLGYVQFRKGVDLFIAAAMAAVAADRGANLRFVWVGGGYEPDKDIHYSTYIADQVSRSGLGDRLIFTGELDDLDEVYRAADAVVLTSRIDPMPNTCIDALARGCPVICFAEASGIAEVLAADPATADLVVPYLDVAAMGKRVVDLAADRNTLEQLSAACLRNAAASFDMARYSAQLDALGSEAAEEAAALSEDHELIKSEKAFDAGFFAGPHGEAPEDQALWDYLIRNRVVRAGAGDNAALGLRRPFPGFQTLIYDEDMGGGGSLHDPLADWLRRGRPAGRWVHDVIRLKDVDAPALPKTTRTLLHGHFHYADLIGDFLKRLNVNALRCDLVLTTTDDERAAVLREGLAGYERGLVDVRVVPNRGRDIGAFLTGLDGVSLDDYDVIGHVHGKKSVHLDTGIGDGWREFLWEHTIGGMTPAADIAVATLMATEELGLLFPDDPYICGWDKNRSIAEELAAKLGLAELPQAFDWPNGTMFWARREALEPLFALSLGWEDYPVEPVPEDGTILHTLERLIPFAARLAGYEYKTTHLPDVQR
ncbi:rhamnan synthesis F family protein [Thalassobaculum litoreum]|nr:rhamnan synthesis F family protein [Thalassobaculum litoreum]